MLTPRGNVALVVLLTLAGFSPGCSFIFTESVPSDHQKLPYFDCTSTYGLSVADGLFAASAAIGAGSTLSQSKADFASKNNGDSRNAEGAVDIAVAALMTASTVYGAVQATRCDRAKEELRARILAPPLRPPVPMPAPWVPPPPPPPPQIQAPPPLTPPSPALPPAPPVGPTP